MRIINVNFKFDLTVVLLLLLAM